MFGEIRSMEKYVAPLLIVIGLVLAGRIILMNYFFDHTKPRKTKKVTDARFEINTNDSEARAVTLKRKKDSCLVTISSITGNDERIESEFNTDNAVLDDIERITVKYDFQSAKKFPDGHLHEGRSFSIDYGTEVRYFVRYYQQLPAELISMLNEIELVLKQIMQDKGFFE